MKKALFVLMVLAFTRYQLLDYFGKVPRVNPMGGPATSTHLIDRVC
jgi:hypothetical protein